jgi:hypothetical protein
LTGTRNSIDDSQTGSLPAGFACDSHS